MNRYSRAIKKNQPHYRECSKVGCETETYKYDFHSIPWCGVHSKDKGELRHQYWKRNIQGKRFRGAWNNLSETHGFGTYECPTCGGGCTYAEFGTQNCCHCIARSQQGSAVRLQAMCGKCDTRRDRLTDWVYK